MRNFYEIHGHLKIFSIIYLMLIAFGTDASVETLKQRHAEQNERVKVCEYLYMHYAQSYQSDWSTYMCGNRDKWGHATVTTLIYNQPTYSLPVIHPYVMHNPPRFATP